MAETEFCSLNILRQYLADLRSHRFSHGFIGQLAAVTIQLAFNRGISSDDLGTSSQELDFLWQFYRREQRCDYDRRLKAFLALQAGGGQYEPVLATKARVAV
jgi:hypothetical protein